MVMRAALFIATVVLGSCCPVTQAGAICLFATNSPNLGVKLDNANITASSGAVVSLTGTVMNNGTSTLEFESAGICEAGPQPFIEILDVSSVLSGSRLSPGDSFSGLLAEFQISSELPLVTMGGLLINFRNPDDPTTLPVSFEADFTVTIASPTSPPGGGAAGGAEVPEPSTGFMAGVALIVLITALPKTRPATLRRVRFPG
ncbi:MAG: hypothetical protein JWO48_835 [Bryobacterales bacterium]|nr:hypothetical protein [Bryobacterales bacterium]